MNALKASGRYKDQCEGAMTEAVNDKPPDNLDTLPKPIRDLHEKLQKRREEAQGPLEGQESRRIRRGHPCRVPPGRVAEDRVTTNSIGPRLVAALGIVLFREGPFLSDAELDVKRALHRHSIRLSALNAQQRADLVHQLSQGLEIYHRGGIKPETVAELLLLAGQVGALGFIGAQQ